MLIATFGSNRYFNLIICFCNSKQGKELKTKRARQSICVFFKEWVFFKTEIHTREDNPSCQDCCRWKTFCDAQIKKWSFFKWYCQGICFNQNIIIVVDKATKDIVFITKFIPFDVMEVKSKAYVERFTRTLINDLLL